MTNELLIKVSTTISDSTWTWTHFGPKLRNKPSLGHIFRTLEMCITTLYAHFLECTRRVAGVGARTGSMQD